jgi:nucleotide-binding universal stress UspA family protein
MKKILVPLTLSGESLAALPLAAHFAQACNASVVLLHVAQRGLAHGGASAAWAGSWNETCRHAAAQLHALAASLRVPAEILVCAGRPGETIVSQAKQLGADAIVMCTHGCRGLWKWLHRNTAGEVFDRAPCPVWQISPSRNSQAFTLTLADQAACDRKREPTHPLRLLLQVLFPPLATAKRGATRKVFTLNLTLDPSPAGLDRFHPEAWLAALQPRETKFSP